MTIPGRDKLKKFRERLYTQRLSPLLRKGVRGLNPLEKYKTDDKGRPLVEVREITRFFLRATAKAGRISTDAYLSALYELFRELTLGAGPVSFDCGFSVSEEKIQAADNKTTIELLTANIIITYFNHLKTYKGTVDRSLLTPDLRELILKSGEGRDYKALVNNTLAGLAQSLEQDRPWRAYLDDLTHTDLVCRLAGARLPPMEKEPLARILDKSYREINEIDSLFTRTLTARARLVSREGNPKTYIKSMEKLDTAVLTLLAKSDHYLAAAHQLMETLYLPYSVVLGKADTSLRQNMVWLFLNARPDKGGRWDIKKNLGMPQLRYRLNMLFTYPDITRYAGTFKDSDGLTALYFDLFRLLFKEAEKKITCDAPDIKALPRVLDETARAVEQLNLDEARLMDEKQRLKKAYIQLIHRTETDALPAVMALCPPICRATQDRSREIMAQVRPALIKACYTQLCSLKDSSGPDGRSASDIRKHLNAFARHYQPRREFFRLFFDTYAGPVPSTMPGLNHSPKALAPALLMVFADETAMEDLLPEDRIARAADLLAELRQKK